MSLRIVITGAGGLVGRTLAAAARDRGHDVAALTSSDCDITDPAAVAQTLAAGPDGSAGAVVVNCAAYTRVDDAERDAARAEAVNVEGARNVASACAAAGAKLLHVSTDYVFSGDFGGRTPRPYDVDDRTGPLSVYGRTKLAGESAVLAASPAARVVRTSWLFSGGDGGDFVAVMRGKAAAGVAVDVVADQVGTPTYVGDLAAALLQLAEDDGIAGPILHASNGGAASRYDQARAVYELVGADAELVRPVGTDRHPRPAPRPPYSALSAHTSALAGLTALRPWRDALAAALAAAGPLPSTP